MERKQKNESHLVLEIEDALKEVIDPETKSDVWSMRLVKDLKIDEHTGNVNLIFKPTSHYCPLAYTLGLDIKNKIKGIKGINDVKIEVEGFAHSAQLKEILSDE